MPATRSENIETLIEAIKFIRPIVQHLQLLPPSAARDTQFWEARNRFFNLHARLVSLVQRTYNVNLIEAQELTDELLQ